MLFTYLRLDIHKTQSIPYTSSTTLLHLFMRGIFDIMAFNTQNAKSICLMSVFLIKDNPTMLTLWFGLTFKYFALQRVIECRHAPPEAIAQSSCSSNSCPLYFFGQPLTWRDFLAEFCRILPLARRCLRWGNHLFCVFLARSCSQWPPGRFGQRLAIVAAQ